MFTTRKVGEPHIYTKPTPAEFFKTTYDWLKNLGKIGASILAFTIISIFGFASGYKIIGILGLFYILCIIFRIPDTYTDIFPFEVISGLTLIIFLVRGVEVALFFAVTATWLSRFTSPFGAVEEYTETFSNTVGDSVAPLLGGLLVGYANGNLLLFMLYYILTVLIVETFVLWLTSPAILIPNLFHSAASFPMVILETYIIMLLIGVPVLESLGITGWTLPSLRVLLLGG